MVLLLLTDGKPEATAELRSGHLLPLARRRGRRGRECRTQSEIDTYVLGVGPFLGALDDIADAGGTERAYLVEGDDVSARVLQA